MVGAAAALTGLGWAMGRILFGADGLLSVDLPSKPETGASRLHRGREALRLGLSVPLNPPSDGSTQHV